MTASDFLSNLPDTINPELLEGLESIVNFDLEGEGGGVFSLHINNNKVVFSNQLSETPKCAISGSASSFMAVVRKDLNPIVAIMSGKLKATNQQEILKVAKVIGLN